MYDRTLCNQKPCHHWGKFKWNDSYIQINSCSWYEASFSCISPSLKNYPQNWPAPQIQICSQDIVLESLYLLFCPKLFLTKHNVRAFTSSIYVKPASLKFRRSQPIHSFAFLTTENCRLIPCAFFHHFKDPEVTGNKCMNAVLISYGSF